MISAHYGSLQKTVQFVSGPVSTERATRWLKHGLTRAYSGMHLASELEAMAKLCFRASASDADQHSARPHVDKMLFSGWHCMQKS